MSKPLMAILLGGILGAIDGLSALVSAPETAPEILSIVIGSTAKGLIVGLLIGLFARKRTAMQPVLVFGLIAGLFFAFLVAYMNYKAAGQHYWWQIMLPGSIVGLIVGYATQKYGRPATTPART